MKTILLLVHDDEGQEARLQAALDVTRAVEGHLTCLDVAIMPELMGDYYSGAGAAMLLEDERARESANRTRTEARLAHEDVPWDWHEMLGGAAECLRSASALADLIVVNRRFEAIGSPVVAALAGEVVLSAHKPILAVPATSRGMDCAGHAMVAWNGSLSASAALRAAAPLLKLAGEVTIVEVSDGPVERPAEEAAAYLAHHGIKPVVRVLSNRGAAPATVLLDEVTDRDPAYLVMGGFGHRRFVEALLGGVTRTMLNHSPVPLLMAH